MTTGSASNFTILLLKKVSSTMVKCSTSNLMVCLLKKVVKCDMMAGGSGGGLQSRGGIQGMGLTGTSLCQSIWWVVWCLRRICIFFRVLQGSVLVGTRFVPSSMRRQVRRTVEDFVAFWTAVFNVDDSGATMLGQPKGVFIKLFAKPTNIVSNVVLNFGQFGFGFFGDFHHVEGRVYVALSHHQVLIRTQFPNDGSGNRRTIVFIENQLSGSPSGDSWRGLLLPGEGVQGGVIGAWLFKLKSKGQEVSSKGSE